MARTTLTPTQAPGSYAGTGVAVIMTAADAVNLNQFRASGKDLVIVQNTGIGGHTFTVTSEPDPYGRSGDIAAEAIAAGEIRVVGPLEVEGWMQPDGNVYLQADSNEVKFGVLRL